MKTKTYVQAFRDAAELIIEAEQPLYLFPAFEKVANDKLQAVALMYLWRAGMGTDTPVAQRWELEDREARALGCLLMAEMYSNWDTFLETFKKVKHPRIR